MNSTNAYFESIESYLAAPEFQKQLIDVALDALRADETKQSAVLNTLRWRPESVDDTGPMLERLSRVAGGAPDPAGVASDSYLELFVRYRNEGFTLDEAMNCATTIAKRKAGRDAKQAGHDVPLRPGQPEAPTNVLQSIIETEQLARLVEILPTLEDDERRYLELRLGADLKPRVLATMLGFVSSPDPKTKNDKRVLDQQMNRFYKWSFDLLKKVRTRIEGRRR